MSLVTMKELLTLARRDRYAVGAFEAWNLESIQAIVRAAEALAAPVILAISRRAIEYATIEPLSMIAVAAARAAAVPVAIHLDHGESYERVVSAIRSGCTSVMIDASHESFDDNVRLTAEVVKVAHAVGVTVEGELGVLGTKEGGEAADNEVFTDPDDAKAYVDASGIDALAVAIGNVHGFYRGEPKIDFSRLQAIRDAVDVPLVLHGGTGIPLPALHQAIDGGICKINIATQLIDAFAQGYANAYRDLNDPINVINAFAPTRDRAQELVAGKIDSFLIAPRCAPVS